MIGFTRRLSLKAKGNFEMHLLTQFSVIIVLAYSEDWDSEDFGE